MHCADFSKDGQGLVFSLSIFLTSAELTEVLSGLSLCFMNKGEKQQKQNKSSGLQVSAGEGGTNSRASRCAVAGCREGRGCGKVLDTGTALAPKPSPCPGCKVPPGTGSELWRTKSNFPATKKSSARPPPSRRVKQGRQFPAPGCPPRRRSAGKGEGAAVAVSAGTIHCRATVRFAVCPLITIKPRFLFVFQGASSMWHCFLGLSCGWANP